mgnify:CR=1 FL=1
MSHEIFNYCTRRKYDLEMITADLNYDKAVSIIKVNVVVFILDHFIHSTITEIVLNYFYIPKNKIIP